MDLGLAGKRAFVSGSSSGIGRGIALELASEGCNVVVHGRSKAKTEQVADELGARGAKVAIALGDLATQEGIESATSAAISGFGHIDILINNCGASLRKDEPDWTTLDPCDWIDSMKVNFVSAVSLAQRFSPAMKEQRWGRIINVSSLAGSQAFPNRIDYGAPKAALNKWTVDLSKILGPYSVTVNAVVPGTTMTEALEKTIAFLKQKFDWGNDPQVIERKYHELYPQSVPRFGTTRDVATAVAYLASPLAGYINGASLRVDGRMANSL
jgi:NAD(P)-dependent dehydrogenase (short-subunit alcohol dehydrogenase family)